MKVTVMLLMVAVAIAPLRAFTTSEEKESKEDHSGSDCNPPSFPPSCSSLRTYYIDYEVFFKVQPLTLFQSTTTQFNCTKLVYTGPADEDDHYSGTIVALQLGNYFTIDANYTNSVDTNWCASGAKIHFPIIQARFDKEYSYYCLAQCAPDGVGYLNVLCGGRRAKDKVATQKFLDDTFGSTLTFLDMEAGCPQPQHCYAFSF